MLDGYIVLYTGWAGLQQFASMGNCQAKLLPKEKWEYQIVVPIKATNIYWDGGENDIPDNIKVDLNSK